MPVLPGTRAFHAECEAEGKLDLQYTNKRGTRGYFCNKHQKWAYDDPIETVYHYEDGTSIKKSEISE